VATPSRAESLARAVGRTNWLYAQYVNRLHGRSGHLWQNRFYSCALDEGHFWAAMCYVERNPLRAGLVRVPWGYAWSSAAAHCGVSRPRDEGNAGRRKSGPSKTGALKPGEGESVALQTPPGEGAEWLLDLSRWREMLGRRDWREFLGQGLADRQMKDLRRCTLTGRPLGSDSFLSKLETALGRRLRPLPVGRPRKRKMGKTGKIK